MNAVVEPAAEAVFAPVAGRQQKRVAAGIAISLLAHALLLSLSRPPQAALRERPSVPLTVRLQAPPQPAPAVQPAAAPAAEPVPAPTPARTAPAPRSKPERRIIAVPPRTEAPAEDRLKVKETPPEPARPADPPSPTPRFSLDAARGMARAVANEPDPAKAGTALERLPPKPLQTESRLERGIKEAKRPLCKDGVPGGLLAPIFLAMDKKDSGCKW